ncbi:hypothetical protein ACO0R3_003593 [Hanseniaspora guilliermondii]
MSEKKTNSDVSDAIKQKNLDPQNKKTNDKITFVPAISIYGKVNTILTNDPEGYHNKESDEVYDLLSSALEIYMRDIVKKMSENRKQRLKRVSKVVNGKPVNLSEINKAIEKINKQEKKLEIQRMRSRKENGIDSVEDSTSGAGDTDNQNNTGKAQNEEQQPKMSAKAVANSQSLESQMNDNNSTANLFTGGMNKKYSWLSSGTNSKLGGASSVSKSLGGALGAPSFNAGDSSYVQSDIRNHIIKEEKNLVMRDLIKVLESEMNNANKKLSTADIQEILAKGYARLRD